MRSCLTSRIFSPVKALFKRYAAWKIVLQVFAFIGMLSIYTLRRNGISGFPSSYGWPENGILDNTGRTKLIEFVSNELPKLPSTFTLNNDTASYFTEIVPGLSCFQKGTDFEKTAAAGRQLKNCSCVPGYFGRDCGIPEPIWFSCKHDDLWHRKLIQRGTPRRLIHGINVNHELEFFEARIKEIGDVVDVLIVGESNYTAGGDYSPIFLLPELKKGLVDEYQHKIIHVLIDRFPPRGFVDGWFADTFFRNEMGHVGLNRIQGIRDDDLFLLLDADEIPDKRVLLFLKLYDGYPEPISLTLRWSVYGFFWKRKQKSSSNEEDVTRIVALSTMRMIREVYDGKVMSLRRNHIDKEPLSSRYHKYAEEHENSVREWNIGTVGHYAGHHCSWCYKSEGIRLKLLSAQKDDKPRWGDYPEKLNLSYISSLIKNGQWFDGTSPFILVHPEEDSQYAPQFFLDNPRRFQYLLTPPVPDA